jgi:hypothetical protein
VKRLRAVVLFLAFCLLVLGAGYVNQRHTLAAQADELRLLRTQREAQHEAILEYSVYLPYLEERLKHYEAGTPAQWHEAARRRNEQQMQAGQERARRAHGELLRGRYEGSDGVSGAAGGR